MTNFCGDLLEETERLYDMLFYLELSLFGLFLFSVGLVSMIRPPEAGDDDDDSSNDSKERSPS